MWELAGTQFERGIFELRLERPAGGLRTLATGLGPIRGRLIALIFLVSAGFLTLYHQPGQMALDHGWVTSLEAAHRLENIVTWTFIAIGLLVYAAAFLFRQESLSLIFDRHALELRWIQTGPWARSRVREGVCPFSGIEAINAHGPDREPRTPHGYLEISAKSFTSPEKRSWRFRVLSDEQFKIFPTNIGRIIQKDPQGDWVDPDAEFLQNP